MVVQRQPLFGHLLMQKCRADLAQIARKNCVKILRACPRGRKIAQQRRGCRRHHRRTHVVDVMHRKILHAAKRHRQHRHARAAVRPHQAGPRGGGRPLGRGGALGTVLQRRAELPLCRAKMAACQRQDPLGHAARRKHRGKAQRLRHGRARAVDARKRDAQLPHRVVAGRTLGLQVARKRKIDFGTRNIRLAQTELHGLAL